LGDEFAAISGRAGAKAPEGMSTLPPKKKKPKHEVLVAPMTSTVDEEVQAKTDEFKAGKWKIISRTHNPMQSNTYDCGVFVILFMDLIMLGVPLMFGCGDIALTRRRLTLEILNDMDEKAKVIDAVN